MLRLLNLRCSFCSSPLDETHKRESLAGEHLLTAHACAMTEAMRAVYACPDRESVAAELDRLLSWLMHSNVPEMKRVAAMLCAERGAS